MGILATLLFTGRRFYLLAIRRALFIRSAESVDPAAVAGVRVFLVSFMVFFGYLMSVRLDWQIALLYGGFIIMTYIVMARILAESGSISITPSGRPRQFFSVSWARAPSVWSRFYYWAY